MTQAHPQQDSLKQQEDALFAQGEAAMQRGDYEEAIGCFKRTLYFNLDRHDAHYHLGVIFLNSSDILSAIDHLQYAVAIDPANIKSWINLGYARVFAGLSLIHI